MKSVEMGAFVREGLRRYADARDAVDAFEREIQDRLCEALEQKNNWENFKASPVVRGERGRGKAISSGVWGGDTGRTIWAYRVASDESDGWVDLGLWWASPSFPDAVVAYCSRLDPGNRPRPIALSEPRRPIECGAVDRGKKRLFAVLDDRVDLWGTVALLLDEMDRALGEMK